VLKENNPRQDHMFTCMVYEGSVEHAVFAHFILQPILAAVSLANEMRGRGRLRLHRLLKPTHSRERVHM